LRAAAIVLGVCAFGFTLLTTKGLTNDHYMYLGWAQQVQLGDVPGRDFVDPGMPLQYMLSAAALSLMPGPAAEVLVTSVPLVDGRLPGAATAWLRG